MSVEKINMPTQPASPPMPTTELTAWRGTVLGSQLAAPLAIFTVLAVRHLLQPRFSCGRQVPLQDLGRLAESSGKAAFAVLC